MEALRLNHLVMHFGSQRVLAGVNLSVPERGVFGLIGKNGAGKTTLMKLILGFLKADSGEITVCGQRAGYGYARANRLIGYLPDVPQFYNDLSADEYLQLIGRATGLSAGETVGRSHELLELAGLSAGRKRIGHFSRGMKQRLGIAAALLNRPRLLICDEATSALDPEGRKDILDLLAFAGQTASILLSTHILSDVERICGRIALLNGGMIVLDGQTDELRRRHGERIELTFFTDQEAIRVASRLRQESFILSADVTGSVCIVRLTGHRAHAPALVAALAASGAALHSYRPLEETLEAIYLEAVQ
ncbi:MAG: ABC transporter ATP-binding protein [Sporolactobacillus sp.]